MTSENRKTIFTEELQKLKNENYLDEQDYQKVANAYDQYYAKVLETKNEEKERLAMLRLARQEEAKKTEAEHKEKLRLEKERKRLSPEQIRERNISLSLIAGVILLLLGGLVLATSSWEKMNNIMKVFSIAIVSLSFFGISFIAKRYLKIEKTAFAFLTLASLLIPVTFIGIGYFQLFGEWLSLYGDGKFVLGIITTAICLLVYTTIAYQNKNRLFIWLSFFTLTAFTSFILAAIQLPIDLFYLGIILYNGFILASYHYLKTSLKLEIIVREIPLFSQANLVVSTLLMLVMFQNHVLYSINLLLTAVMYIAVVFVYNKKQFHYVFTLLFIYGMYQLLEHSFLQPVNYIGFAMIGIIYLLLEEKVTDPLLKKVFKWTSGIVSVLAFLLISFEGLVLRADHDSFVLLIAYLIISCNYIYLAFITKRKVFQFLAPIFLVATGFQSWNLLSSTFQFTFFEIYMFTVGVFLFYFVYVKNSNKYLQPIKDSSFYISIVTMALSIFSSYIENEFLELAILLACFGVIMMMIHVIHPKKQYQTISSWLLPSVWLFAFLFIFEEYAYESNFYINEVGINGHLAISALFLFAISYQLRKYKKLLFLPMFYVTIFGYSLSLVSTLSNAVMPIIQSSLFFIGIGLYVALVYETKNKRYWSLVAITTAAFFLTFIDLFKLYESYRLLTFYLFTVPVLLLFIYEFIGRKVSDCKPYFFWTAHGLLVVFQLLTFVYYMFTSDGTFAFLIPTIVYGYSVMKQEKEMFRKLFLYLGLLTIPMNVLLFVGNFNLNVMFEQSLALSMLLIGLLWLSLSQEWKRRIDLFLIGLGVITLVSFVALSQLPLFDVITVSIISAFTILLLYKRKWQALAIIPLFLGAISISEFTFSLEKPMNMISLLMVVLFLHIVGMLVHKKIYVQGDDWRNSYVDWFTVITALFIFQIDQLILYRDPLWLKLVPSLLFIYLLFMQIKRIDREVVKKIWITVTALATLHPYYLIVEEINVPALLEMEVMVLPFLVLTIFLSKKAWSNYRKVMKIIQAVVLVIVAMLIVSDALQSNTINDALIIGGLSILSIIAGMHYRIKSYFFVGIAVLLVNVLLQTKPFWGNLPWWMYLIIGGATLIGFASFYEWQKQRPTKEGKTFLHEKKEMFLNSLKEWD